ncbi:MAG: hypothetical protein OJF59_000685 [Cytophagales bacterium]|jgi:hypothetical protein|nr:hypothetical protein [Bacteroidota bacterium]MBS1979679.1 hypothetical protein [Bacteroidota bacterium]WHZ06932.1 MAG: hypothetical protein OJF59_000685 [Cytophagales bacterium]
MNLEEFKSSIKGNEPPDQVSVLLKALWHEAKENWEHAHALAQEIESKDGSWVHAYLHRREGDPSNARYWYTRAGKQFPTIRLGKEWEEIVTELLSRE